MAREPMQQQIDQLKAANRVQQEEIQEQAIQIARLEQRQQSLLAVLKNGVAILSE